MSYQSRSRPVLITRSRVISARQSLDEENCNGQTFPRATRDPPIGALRRDVEAVLQIETIFNQGSLEQHGGVVRT